MNSELPEELTRMVRKLNGSQLHILNHLVVDRLKIIHQVRDMCALKEFQIFDRVKFNHHGETMKGVLQSRRNLQELSQH